MLIDNEKCAKIIKKLSGDFMYSMGIDIGGTKCAVVLGRGEITENIADFIIDKISFPTCVERGWREVVNQISAEGDALLARNGVKIGELLGVGISCGGPLDSKRGVIQCPPNLPDWDGVPVVQIISEHFGVRTVLQNDANACAVAEWRFGAGRGSENMMFLTFGTGMGAGLILNGKLYAGACDMAGEVGHIRLCEDGPEGYGKKGSFEGFCSGGGIARLAKLTAEKYLAANKTSTLFKTNEDVENITAKSLAEARENGDAFAAEVYGICAEKLGAALAMFCDIINPEVIVIGSIYERNEAFFKPLVREIIEREALPQTAAACTVKGAELGDKIGDYAALGLLF